MDGLRAGTENGQLFSTHDGGQTWSDTTPPLPVEASKGNVAYTLAARPGLVGLRADVSGNPALAMLFDLKPGGSWKLVQSLHDKSIGDSVPVAMPIAISETGGLTAVVDNGREILPSRKRAPQ